jgi:hypothetical protein
MTERRKGHQDRGSAEERIQDQTTRFDSGDVGHHQGKAVVQRSDREGMSDGGGVGRDMGSLRWSDVESPLQIIFLERLRVRSALALRTQKRFTNLTHASLTN